MFLSRNQGNNVYPFEPQFYYIKVGFKGVKIISACFRDEYIYAMSGNVMNGKNSYSFSLHEIFTEKKKKKKRIFFLSNTNSSSEKHNLTGNRHSWFSFILTSRWLKYRLAPRPWCHGLSLLTISWFKFMYDTLYSQSLIVGLWHQDISKISCCYQRGETSNK